MICNGILYADLLFLLCYHLGHAQGNTYCNIIYLADVPKINTDHNL